MPSPKHTQGAPVKGALPARPPRFISFQVATSHDYEISLFGLDQAGRLWVKPRAMDPLCGWSLVDHI